MTQPEHHHFTVQYCNWCPVPEAPDPQHHPGGDAAHTRGDTTTGHGTVIRGHHTWEALYPHVDGNGWRKCIYCGQTAVNAEEITGYDQTGCPAQVAMFE